MNKSDTVPECIRFSYFESRLDLISETGLDHLTELCMLQVCLLSKIYRLSTRVLSVPLHKHPLLNIHLTSNEI